MKRRLFTSIEHYGHCWFLTPCFCFKLIGSWQREWEVVFYRIWNKFYQSNYSLVISVSISRLLVLCLVWQLNWSFFFSTIMAYHMELWLTYLARIFSSFLPLFSLSFSQSIVFLVPDSTGDFFLRSPLCSVSHVCEGHSSFLLSAVALKTLAMSIPSSMLSFSSGI